jgi:hypothetical protein
MTTKTTPAPAPPGDPFHDARQRLGVLADRICTEKDAGALRVLCAEIGAVADALGNQVEHHARTSSREVWPRDLNAPEGDPGWGRDPKGVHGG